METLSQEGGTRRVIAFPPLMLNITGSDGLWGVEGCIDFT